MLDLVENIFYSIFLGLGLTILITFLLYLFAILLEVQMSVKSLILSIIMFVCLWIFSSQIVSGVKAKFNLSEATDYIESTYNAELKDVNVEATKQAIISLYPHLVNLFDLVEVVDPYNSEIFIDDSHATLNHNIWKRVGYFVTSILLLGIPAFLFGQRRTSYKERRVTRNNNTSRHAENSQRSRYVSRHRF